MSRFSDSHDGVDGVPGPTGPKGDIGLTGPQGPKGDQGDMPNLSSYAGDILPAADNTYVLGNSENRWKSISIGEGTIFITDSTLGTDAGITIDNGVFFINGVAQAQLPNLVVTNLTFNDNTVQTTAYTGAIGVSGNGEVTRWSPNFQATGLAFTGTGTTYPTYNSHYVKNGRMVSFFIEIDMSTVTNFGTGQYKTALPYAPLTGTMNHFQSWCLVDETANPDNTGHAILQADHLANTSVLDLHYIKQSGGANSPVMEALFKQGSPVTLTTATHVYINGTYITAE
jgi:hypothetical protein